MENKITFVVFTFNEERRIEYVLRCFKNYGNILVMDDGSTDRTIEIAHQYGAKIVRREKCDYMFVEQEHILQQVYDHIETPWIYWAYADEILPRPLIERLREISNQEKIKMVVIPKQNLTYGIENFVMMKRDTNARFFMRGYISFKNNPIHQMGTFLGNKDEICYLPRVKDLSIMHCSNYTVERYIKNINSYSTTEAIQRVNSHGVASLKDLLIDPLFSFFRIYLFEGNWKFGYGGLIMSMQIFIYRFLTSSKVWELNNNISSDSIETRYNAIKERMLDEL